MVEKPIVVPIHIGEDKLTGVPAIAEFRGEDKRRTYYLLEKGLIPAAKEGSLWIASKRVLREQYEAAVKGRAA